MPEHGPDTLTVLVDVTGLPRFGEILDLWTASGILRMHLRAAPPQDGAWTAQVVGGAESGHQHPLERYVASSGATAVRVLLTQTWVGDNPAAPAAMAAAEDLVARLRASRPVDAAVEAVNVVVPVEGVVLDEACFALGQRWAHVVVAPEERTSVEQFAAPVGVDNLASHAALAVAALGGLLAQVPSPPSVLSAVRNREIRSMTVVRSMARVVDVGPFIRDAAALVAVPGLGGWDLPTGGSPVPEPAEDADALISKVSDQICGVPESPFVERPAPKGPEPPPTVAIGPREALLRAIGFVARRSRELPAELSEEAVDTIIDRIEGLVQAATFGADSQFEVRLRAPRATPVASVDPLDASVSAAAGRLLRAMDEDVSLSAQPEVWNYLLRCAFGLLDGGHLPAGLEVPEGPDRRVVVQQPGLISPPPDTFPLPPQADFPGDSELSPFDRLRAEQALEALRSRDPGHASGSTAPAGSSPQEPDDQPEVAADGPVDAVTALEAWVDECRRSLLWRVMGGLQDDRRRAGASLQAALGELAELLQQPADDLPGRPRLGLAGGLGVTLAILGIGLAPVFVPVGLADPSVALAGGIAAVVGGVGLILGSIALQEWRIFRAINRRNLRRWRLRCAALRVRHGAREVRRLAMVDRLLGHWAEVISYVCHWPFGRPSGTEPASEATSTLPGIAESDIPLGLQLGQSSVSSDGLARLANIARAQVLSAGWLSARYAELEATCLQRLSFRVPYAGDVAPRLIDDARPGQNTALGFFLDLLRSEPEFTDDHDRLVAAVGDATTGDSLSRLVGPVTAVHQRPGVGRQSSLTSFLGALFPPLDPDPEWPGMARALWEQEVPMSGRSWGQVSLPAIEMGTLPGDVSCRPPVLTASDSALLMSVRVDSCPAWPYPIGGGGLRLATAAVARTHQRSLHLVDDAVDKRIA